MHNSKMLKKRLIFTLLFDRGHFVLSRNFRLQKVGDLLWLKNNYDFSKISFFIDELIVLDVSRGIRNRDLFVNTLSKIAIGCFAPIAAGGGIENLEDARRVLRSGADKVVLNSALSNNLTLVREIAEEFGQQCIIGSLDLKRTVQGEYCIYTHNGEHKQAVGLTDFLDSQAVSSLGEIYLNSIDRDGTGQGYDFDTLNFVPDSCTLPLILAGGAGNSRHLLEGLKHPRVDAVATAHLFNFVGDGLKRARGVLLDSGVKLAYWPDISTLNLKKEYH